jgi:septal ring factor EnvC (AmiA/AmiB activator)
MEAALDSLQQKVTRVAARCRELHAENQTLRTQLAALAREHDTLRDKLDAASARLERLVEQLPDA